MPRKQSRSLEWMRSYARDPRHMSHTLTTNGWPAMRSDHWTRLDPDERGWRMHVIDTSAVPPEGVAASVVVWARQALTTTRRQPKGRRMVLQQFK